MYGVRFSPSEASSHNPQSRTSLASSATVGYRKDPPTGQVSGSPAVSFCLFGLPPRLETSDCCVSAEVLYTWKMRSTRSLPSRAQWGRWEAYHEQTVGPWESANPRAPLQFRTSSVQQVKRLSHAMTLHFDCHMFFHAALMFDPN